MFVFANTSDAGGDSFFPGRNHRLAGAAPFRSISHLFWVMWSFIGLVSAADAYLVYHFLEVIPGVEENPLCRYLIMLDSERLSVFLPAKALGTFMVLMILRIIFVCRREYSMPITGAVAAFQAGLAVYLVAA